VARVSVQVVEEFAGEHQASAGRDSGGLIPDRFDLAELAGASAHSALV
jgi:hypothetical protein